VNVATRHGNVVVETREASLGALIEATGGSLRSSAGSVPVNAREVAGLPAWAQAIRIAAQGIAKHELAVWRGRDTVRRRVTATWQARFFADPPNERDPWCNVWEGTESSLTSRNNAFWLKQHDGGRVVAVYVMHPDLVETRWDTELRRAEYRVMLDTGRWSEWLTSADILHFRAGYPSPGAVLAPSPVELYRRTWAAALAKVRSEENQHSRGLSRSVAVVFPEKMAPDQAERWKRVYLGAGGVIDDKPVKVFGGGPTIQEIGLSLSDAQFVESMAFAIEDVGRILGVPPSLLWAASKEGSRPITPEHEEDRWHRYGLQPRRVRIEQTISADPDFFGAGARDYPSFLFDSVRADVRTEAETLVGLVQAGILLVDEARGKVGMAPLPGGVGQIPQITPVGGAPNPTPMPAPAEPAQPAQNTPGSLGGPRERIVIEPEVRVEIPDIRVEPSPAPNVNVQVAAPDLSGLEEIADRIAAAVDGIAGKEPVQVTVEAPEVTVQVPEPPPPTVIVDNGQPAKKVTIDRNAQGWIKGATIEDA
jgi:HK97 family phage portal protein